MVSTAGAKARIGHLHIPGEFNKRYVDANLRTESTSRRCHSVDGGSVKKIVVVYALRQQESTATLAVYITLVRSFVASRFIVF